MRIFILATLIVFTFSFSFPLYAQEKEETIFSKASDKQISESDNFYKSCAQNEHMSNRKNCKCAATKYLEARLKLGDKATVSEIIALNINKCLKDERRNSIEGTLPDTSEITDKQLDEANAIFEECKSTLKMSRFYDCECYAAEYLDERIKQGPLASKTSVALPIYNKCRNIIETTGWEYTRCMKKTEYRPINNIESKPYCECYARKWAELFEAHQGIINLDSKSLIRRRATAYCKYYEEYE